MATTWTPSDLIAAIPVNSALVAQAGDNVLSKDDAVLALLRRFGITGEDVGSLDFSTVPENYRYAFGKAEKLLGLVDTIVEALPENLRTATVLDSVDVRPWLAELVGKPIEYRKVLAWSPDSRRTDTEGKFYTADDAEAFTAMFANAAQQRLLEYGDATQTDTSGAAATVGEYDQTQAGTVLTPESVATSQTQSTNQFNDIVSSNLMQDGLTEEQLRIAFTQTMANDIYELEGLVGEADNTVGMIEVGQSPFRSLSPAQPAASEQHYRIPGMADRLAKYNWRALGDYLIQGQVTPSEIRILQRKMVAAGLFDQMPDGYEPGDAVDRNTNMAWRALLAETYRRKMPLDATLKELANERRRNLPQLRDPMARSAMNMLASNIIGRGLNDSEADELRTYLIQMRDREGLAAIGADPAVGFSQAGVEQYVAREFAQEAEAIESVNSMQVGLRALEMQ
jgi:hypothetical protein